MMTPETVGLLTKCDNSAQRDAPIQGLQLEGAWQRQAFGAPYVDRL